MTNNLKPIKRGDTTAITRDGREVTQLTWFDKVDGDCVFGVLDEAVSSWYECGSFFYDKEDKRDIFAPVEYEHQYLIKYLGTGSFSVSDFYKSDKEAKDGLHKSWQIISRIEESKREVTND